MGRKPHRQQCSQMARSGTGLVPRNMAGAPNHLEHKASSFDMGHCILNQAGMPPLLALRVPSFFAVAVTVTLVWGFCVFVLQDRFAGMVGALLLITSGLYAGPHVGRTGDYDALLTLLILIYSLAFWLAVEGMSLGLSWLAVSAFCVALAILTKGIAGLLPLPGLLAYAVLQGRLVPLLGRWKAWALFGGLIIFGVRII